MLQTRLLSIGWFLAGVYVTKYIIYSDLGLVPHKHQVNFSCITVLVCTVEKQQILAMAKVYDIRQTSMQQTLCVMFTEINFTGQHQWVDGVLGCSAPKREC